MTDLVSINGKIAKLQDSLIPIADRGLLYGEAISEVIVGFKNVILSFDQHFERLQNSAKHMGIDLNLKKEELEFELRALGEQLPNNVVKKYYRVIITGGTGFGLDMKYPLKPNKYVFAMPAQILPEAIYTNGITLQLQNLGYKNQAHKSKTTHYGYRTAASRSAKSQGFDDVLFTNIENEITEATTANIFFIGRHGDAIEIVTPSETAGILPGITRRNILDLCKRAKIAVLEKVIYEEMIPRYDEAFLCSTVKGLIPVNKIADHKLHTTRNNSAFQQIKRLYLAWVESQVGEKLDWNTGKTV